VKVSTLEYQSRRRTVANHVADTVGLIVCAAIAGGAAGMCAALAFIWFARTT
jgi:hypothetical protein